MYSGDALQETAVDEEAEITQASTMALRCVVRCSAIVSTS